MTYGQYLHCGNNVNPECLFKHPLSSTGDAWDMEPEGGFRNLNPAEVGGGQPRGGQQRGAW